MRKDENLKLHKKFLEEYSKTLNISVSAKNAGFNRKTGAAVAKNFLSVEKNQKALYQTIYENAEMLQVTFGYIVLNYLKVLKWASEEDETGKPRDPVLMLRALEGLTKQIDRETTETETNKSTENPFIDGILNLDTSKI